MYSVYDYLSKFLDSVPKKPTSDVYLNMELMDFSERNPFFQASRAAWPECLQSDAACDFLTKIIAQERSYKALAPWVLTRTGEISTDEDSGQITERKIRSGVDKVLRRKKWEIDGLYELLNLEYDPIYNYDKMSTITTSYEGGESDTTDYNGGQKSTETTSGDVSTTTSYTGSEKQTDVRSGSETDTTTKDGSDTTTRSVWGYNDSEGSHPADSEQHTYDNYRETTTRTNDADTSTSTREFNGRSDKAKTVYGETVPYQTERSSEYLNRSDVKRREFSDRKDTVTESTKGNIGVTTTQEMALSEVEYRRAFDFYERLADIVCEAFTVPIWQNEGGLDAWLYR